MSDPFTLQVPADTRYRIIGPEVAARYVEVLGGTAADGQAVATLVTETLASLVDGDRVGRAEADTRVCDLSFTPGTDGVEIAVRCGARSKVVQYPLHPVRPGTAR